MQRLELSVPQIRNRESKMPDRVCGIEEKDRRSACLPIINRLNRSARFLTSTGAAELGCLRKQAFYFRASG